MLDRLDRLDGRAAVLAAAGHHPYARLTTGADAVVGYRGAGLVGWIGIGPWGPLVCALGDPDTALDFASALADAGTAEARWMHLPRTPVATAAGRLPVRHQDDWDFLWTSTVPGPVPGEDAVVRLTPDDAEAIGELVDRGFPETTSRPGDPRIRAWYGVRDGAGLVAAGADRSRGGVGFLAGLTVDPDRRGRGLGAALTAAMTRRLHAEFGVVALGVMSDNSGAIRLYQRLGYTQSLARSSLAVHQPVDNA